MSVRFNKDKKVIMIGIVLAGGFSALYYLFFDRYVHAESAGLISMFSALLTVKLIEPFYSKVQRHGDGVSESDTNNMTRMLLRMFIGAMLVIGYISIFARSIDPYRKVKSIQTITHILSGIPLGFICIVFAVSSLIYIRIRGRKLSIESKRELKFASYAILCSFVLFALIMFFYILR